MARRSTRPRLPPSRLAQQFKTPLDLPMTGVADTILQTKLSELQAHARKAWNGLERKAVIEIVRAADYAAYIIHCSSEGTDSLDEEALDELRLILNGVAPALVVFLPLMKDGKGLPFGPSAPQNRPLDRLDALQFRHAGPLAALCRHGALRLGADRNGRRDHDADGDAPGYRGTDGRACRALADG